MVPIILKAQFKLLYWRWKWGSIFAGLAFFLEKAMASHSSTLAWKIPWIEEPGRLQSMGSDTTERPHFDFSLSCIGEGNGNPLQCSCLENPRDGGAWWAAVYGVAQSWTQLKHLSSSSSSFLLVPHPQPLILPRAYLHPSHTTSLPFNLS